MKQFIFVTLAVVFGVILWRIGERMSADAIGLAVGVVFGVLAGLPAAVLVLAGGRRRDNMREERQPLQQQYGYGGQPPVIVLTGGQPASQPQALPQNSAAPEWPSARSQERSFRWVGVPEGAGDD